MHFIYICFPVGTDIGLRTRCTFDSKQITGLIVSFSDTITLQFLSNWLMLSLHEKIIMLDLFGFICLLNLAKQCYITSQLNLLFSKSKIHK